MKNTTDKYQKERNMKKPDINNILSIRTYQAVKFEGKLQTFFTTKKTAHHRGVNMHVEKGIGVVVYSDKDAVIIPFPNLGGIHLDTEHKEEKRDAHKKEISKPARAQKLDKVK